MSLMMWLFSVLLFAGITLALLGFTSRYAL
jgi:hypothetical protein